MMSRVFTTKTRRLFKFLNVIVIAATAPTVAAQQTPYLVSSLAEPRAALSSQGFDVEVVATTDFMALIDGGIDTGIDTPANFDIVLTQDTASAGWWPNGSFLLYFLGTTGGDPTTRAGDLQTASNIEATNTFKVFEASYEHRFNDDHVSLLVGLHDINSDFYALEHAGLFLNSSFGIGPELTQTSPSIFPTSSVATRLRLSFDDLYVLTAIYDGIPGDPADETGTHVQLNDGDGIYYISEIGIAGAEEHYYKYSVGTWYSSAEFEDFAAAPQDDNKGIYLLAERDLGRDVDGRGTGVFLQLGIADGKRNQVERYIGAGMTRTGLLPSRPEDVAGIAIGNVRNSAEFRLVNPELGGSETAIELSYLIAPTPWFTIQPDLQYIIDPGTDPATDNALVATMRFQIAF
ncbi:MAG: carbohydrate porin [Pseudomonadota bacterium]